MGAYSFCKSTNDLNLGKAGGRLLIKENQKENSISIKNEWINPCKTNLTAVELFCGCGGMSLGMTAANINILLGSDFFKEAGDTYKNNFNHDFILGDILDVKTKNKIVLLAEKKLKGKNLDILAGGFPCQGFSMAGLRKKEDKRNLLYLELLEVVTELQPKFLFFENVKGILSMEGGRAIAQIVEDFEKIGYSLDYKILNSAHYKVAQKRERVVFLGNRIGLPNLFPKPIIENNFVTVGDAIKNLVSVKENRAINHVPTKHREDIKKRLSKVPVGKSLYPSYSDSWKKNSWDEPSSTIKCNNGAVSIHPKLPRVLTVRECARIQGFPDSFIFSGAKNKQLVQLGNAVPPNLSKAVALAIIKNLKINGELAANYQKRLKAFESQMELRKTCDLCYVSFLGKATARFCSPKCRMRNARRNVFCKKAQQNLLRQEAPNRPLLRYFGGKWRLAKWVKRYFPSTYNIYVEPFSGAASTFFKTIPFGKKAVLNDLCPEVINLLKVLQDSKKSSLFEALIKEASYDQDVFFRSLQMTRTKPELAYRFFIRNWLGFGSSTANRTKKHQTFRKCKKTNLVGQFEQLKTQPPLWHQKLQDAVILNEDYMRVLERYDEKGNFFFIDPPYPYDCRNHKGKMYATEFDNKDHIALATFLKRMKARWVLSCGKSQLYDELFFEFKKIIHPVSNEVLYLNF